MINKVVFSEKSRRTNEEKENNMNYRYQMSRKMLIRKERYSILVKS